VSILALFAACSSGSDNGGPNQSDNVTLTVTVTGGSSVQFYNNQNVLHKCGDANVTGAPNQCSTTVVRGSEVRIQRTLSLPTDEEARWRLSGWTLDCAGIDADAEPRGGMCNLSMTSNKTVHVDFEHRKRLQVVHTGTDPMFVRWSVGMSAQKAGGNPLTRAGTFDCNFPSMLPVCSIDAIYDVNTAITIDAGAGAAPANWQGWGGNCASFLKAAVCTLTLTNDAQVTGSWAFSNALADRH
jgi:hypothetical protein